MIFVFVMIGVWLKDVSLSIFVAISFFYVAFFDLWESTMTTFSSIIVAVIIGIIFGTLLGILSFKFNRINNILLQVSRSTYIKISLTLLNHNP